MQGVGGDPEAARAHIEVVCAKSPQEAACPACVKCLLRRRILEEEVGQRAMKDEIDAAVAFLVRVIARNSSLDRVQVDALGERLRCVLTERFRDHWFPERPSRGQAYRCIRINETEPREPVLEQASRRCGLGYDDLCLPAELTMWVDPEEVGCRFGERRGVYYVLASFKGGRKENFVDQINIDELEQRSGDRPKQSLQEIGSGRKRGVGSGSARPSPWGVGTLKGPTSFSPPQFLSRGGTMWNLSAGLPPTTTPGQKPDKYHWVNKALVKA